MHVGIIVHSHTGNTLSVAEALKETIIKLGHQASIERIKVAGGEDPNNSNFKLEAPPKTEEYDAIIFGAPVRGFSISPVIAAYLRQTNPINAKRVICFVTKHLKSNWTGGTKAINGMKQLCEAKGGKVVAEGIVSLKNRDDAVNALCSKLGLLLK